jgi:Alanine-zipper, major outer membrane lipoprotein
MIRGTMRFTWLLPVSVALAACASHAGPGAAKTEADTAVATANQGKSEAERALSTAQQALQTAQKAESDARAANDRADQMYQRSLRK